jgi:hypothetical protein
LASQINASNSGFGGIVSTGDSSGELQLQTAGTTAVTIDTSQNVTLAGTLAMSSSFMRNRIINGDMRIDQRNAGASVTPTDGQYTVDRFFAGLTQASKFSVQQVTDAPTGFVNSLKATSLSAYSVGTSDTFLISQIIEGLNCSDLSWGTANAQTVTLSFWVKSSLTGTFGGALKNSAANRSYPFSYTISAANTWERKTITIAGDTSGTWLTTNGIGIYVIFGLGGGSTFSGTAGAWTAGNLSQVTGGTSVVGTNGATWQVTGVQLEIGTTATPFERRLYNQELANCQRYYYKIASGASLTNNIAQGVMLNTTVFLVFLQHPVYMRTAPSLVQTTGTNYYCFERSVDQDFFDSFSISQPTERLSVLFNSTQVSGTTGISGACYSNNASASLALSAEL